MNYRAFGIPISLRARDKLRGHTSFERWELAEQRTLKQKENIRKVSSFENKLIKPPTETTPLLIITSQ